MKIAGETGPALRRPARWVAVGVALLVVGLSAWAIVRYATELRTAMAGLVSAVRGPRLPAGFASGNGRIEADKRRALAVITQRESEVRSAAAGIAQRQSDRRRADAAVAQRQSSVERAR